MRILMTSDSYLPLIGGAEIHVSNLITNLKRAGHIVNLITTQRGEDMNGVMRIEWGKRLLKKNFRAIDQAARGADVVHAHYSYRLATLAGLVARKRRIPFVITLHGLGTVTARNVRGAYALADRFYRWVSLNLATCIIATSEDMAVIAYKYVPKERVVVIPNGVDIEKFHPGLPIPREIKEKYSGKKVILTVRRLVPKTGIHYFADAMPGILKRVANAHWVMIGDGRMRGHIEKKINDLGIADSVTMLGAVNNDLVPAYIARANVVVFPSTAESSSIACAEAMAVGAQIVASRVGGLIDLVGKGEERGRFVRLVPWEESRYDAPIKLASDRTDELASAVCEMLEKPYPERARRAAEYVRGRLGWDTVTKQTIDVYMKYTKWKIKRRDQKVAWG